MTTNTLQGTWSRLPPNLRGLIWVSLAGLLFALNDVTVKLLGPTIHPVEMSLFRYGIGFVILSPAFIRAGWGGLRTERLPLHVFRGIIAGLAQATIYYAVIHLMLADVTTLSFTRPMFMTVLAVFILGETVGWRRWFATLVGFTGVIVIMRPGEGTIEPAAAVALGSAFMFSVSTIIIRKLAATESATQILFYYHIVGALLFVGPSIWLWKTPVGIEWLLLLLVGTMTCAAMTCFVRAFHIAEASLLGPIEYIRLVYAALLGFLIFAEVPDIWTWAGAALIIGSAVCIAHREAARGSAKPAGAG